MSTQTQTPAAATSTPLQELTNITSSQNNTNAGNSSSSTNLAGQTRRDFTALGQRLRQDGGNDAVQRRVQEVIAQNNKLDAAVNAARIEADAVRRRIDGDMLRLGRALEQRKLASKQACATLLRLNEELTEKLNGDEYKVLHDRFVDSRDRFMEQIKPMRERAQEAAAEAEKLRVENEELCAAYDAKREEFQRGIEEKIEGFKDEQKDSTSRHHETAVKVQKLELLELRVQAAAKELETLKLEREQVAQHMIMYTQQTTQMAELKEQSDKALVLFTEKKNGLAEVVAALDARKKDLVAQERMLQQQSQRLRSGGQQAQLKKRIANLEKQKAQAEQKYRGLLERAQARRQQHQDPAAVVDDNQQQQQQQQQDEEAE